jgi:hypothetical protein
MCARAYAFVCQQGWLESREGRTQKADAARGGSNETTCHTNAHTPAQHCTQVRQSVGLSKDEDTEIMEHNVQIAGGAVCGIRLRCSCRRPEPQSQCRAHTLLWALSTLSLCVPAARHPHIEHARGFERLLENSPAQIITPSRVHGAAHRVGGRESTVLKPGSECSASGRHIHSLAKAESQHGTRTWRSNAEQVAFSAISVLKAIESNALNSKCHFSSLMFALCHSVLVTLTSVSIDGAPLQIDHGNSHICHAAYVRSCCSRR